MTIKLTPSCSESGATMVEYALLLVLLIGVASGVIHYMSTNMSRQLHYVGQVVGGAN